MAESYKARKGETEKGKTEKKQDSEPECRIGCQCDFCKVMGKAFYDLMQFNENNAKAAAKVAALTTALAAAEERVAALTTALAAAEERVAAAKTAYITVFGHPP